MRNVERLAWKPSKKPSVDDIHGFIERTNGGSGKVVDGDNFFEIKVYPT